MYALERARVSNSMLDLGYIFVGTGTGALSSVMFTSSWCWCSCHITLREVDGSYVINYNLQSLPYICEFVLQPSHISLDRVEVYFDNVKFSGGFLNKCCIERSRVISSSRS